jgi:hypothetical protein
MNMASASDEPDDALEFRRWEYAMVARSDFLWAIAAMPLVRAADALWERASAALATHERVFRRGPDGILADPTTPLTTKELQAIEDTGVERVSLMLLGLAIENVAKTILIGRNQTLVSEAGRFLLKTHDLRYLVSHCSLHVNDEELQQLAILEDYVTWRGRYPVPMAADGKGGPTSNDRAWVPALLGDPRTSWTHGREVLRRLLGVRDAKLLGPDT